MHAEEAIRRLHACGTTTSADGSTRSHLRTSSVIDTPLELRRLRWDKAEKQHDARFFGPIVCPPVTCGCRYHAGQPDEAGVPWECLGVVCIDVTCIGWILGARALLGMGKHWALRVCLAKFLCHVV